MVCFKVLNEQMCVCLWVCVCAFIKQSVCLCFGVLCLFSVSLCMAYFLMRVYVLMRLSICGCLWLSVWVWSLHGACISISRCSTEILFFEVMMEVDWQSAP